MTVGYRATADGAKAMALEEEGLSARFLTGSYDYPSPTATGSVKRDILLLPGFCQIYQDEIPAAGGAYFS